MEPHTPQQMEARLQTERRIVDRKSSMGFRIGVVALVGLLAGALPRGQASSAPDGRDSRDVRNVRDRAYDELLDLNVRDGMVYYRALQAQRGRLDAYIRELASASIAERPEEQIAFWLNAYNAIVLRTVIDHYPIAQRTGAYPARSIRQVPGAFERTSHRVAGRTLTLDQIEQTILPAFQDPRVFLALGRGAVGSGRLRSEAYTLASLDRQLTEIANECVARAQCADVDRDANILRISSVFSWREKEFTAAYAGNAAPLFSSRSPIERAALAFLDRRFLTPERESLAKNAFKVEFIPFDWTLNDLTGRRGR